MPRQYVRFELKTVVGLCFDELIAVKGSNTDEAGFDYAFKLGTDGKQGLCMEPVSIL